MKPHFEIKKILSDGEITPAYPYQASLVWFSDTCEDKSEALRAIKKLGLPFEIIDTTNEIKTPE